MQLYYSPGSPFARKVRACAIIRGIAAGIELVAVSALENPPELVASNPLVKVPALRCDDGSALYDSRVICEYLDEIGDAPKLFPAPGPRRWAALRLQCLADTLTETALLYRRHKPAGDATSQLWHARYGSKISQGLAALAAELPGRELDIGSIAAACGLDYMFSRIAEYDWARQYPALVAWLDDMRTRPGLKETAIPPV